MQEDEYQGDTVYTVCQSESTKDSIEEESTSPIYGKVDTIVGLWGKENVTFDLDENSFELPAEDGKLARTYVRGADVRFHPTITDYSE